MFASIRSNLVKTQVHQSYLAQWATPFHQPFNELIAVYQRALIAMGHAASAAHDIAVGRVYQAYRTQAEVLGYYCAPPSSYVPPQHMRANLVEGESAHRAPVGRKPVAPFVKPPSEPRLR